ncbi:MAG: NADH-quinone oxidoreductase subunit, partial [Chloroflexota bacterium]|nr:NADH-quinone oxidoreductase subunit [Chloroflexota bacterium]
MSWNEWLAIAPFAAVIVAAMLVVVLDMIWPKRDSLVSGVAIAAVLVAMGLTVAAGPLPGPIGALAPTGQEAFSGVYVRDALTAFLDLLFLTIALLTLLFAPDYLRPRGLPMAEFSATLLFAISGAMLIGASRDLLVLFLGLELMVLPGYMLAGYAKRDGLSTEGAIKYFLLGSFSSAIFLFGLAFTFGYLGTTRISAISELLASIAAGEQIGQTLPAGLVMGLALMTTGVAFKAAAVPFHYWTPDAYQGSPTPVTGYLSVGPKIGAFALALRLFVEALGPLRSDWYLAIVVLAALTMTLGNLSALGQDNIKRMLAYSSIAHTGYILVGLAVFAGATDPAVQRTGLQAVLFYGVAYAFMNLGAFACVAALQRRPGVTSQIATFGGLGRRAPLLGLLMTLFLLSLVGIPPTAGFFGKALVLLAAVQAGGWLAALAVLMMLNAAAAAFYYLRIVVFMYMRDAPSNAREITIGSFTRAG